MATKSGEEKKFTPPLLVLLLDPGSGIRDPRSGMDKKSGHPGSATLVQIRSNP